MDVDASLDAIREQRRDLTRKQLSNTIIRLLIFGQVFTASLLVLSGFQLGGFYLEPNILIALIVTTMGGTVAYMFRKVVDFAFG